MKTWLFCLLLTGTVHAQTLQYGVSVDLKWDIVARYGYLSSFRVGVGGGVGVMLNDHFMPHAQLALTAFQGGLGSSLSVHERNKVNFETSFTLGLTGGGSRQPQEFRRPVYTLGRLVPTPLYNPFSGYLTLASTQVFRLTRFQSSNALGKYRYSQKVGSIALGADGFDVNYYNDGTPFHWIGLGDGKDRYWTGGGFVNIHIPNRYDDHRTANGLRNVFIGFDRFTGYFPDAFEVADHLGLGFVPYKDVRQAFFNKGRLYFGGELSSVPGAAILGQLLDNDDWDVQNFIHRKMKAPEHKTFHQRTFGVGLYYNKKYWDL